MIKVVMKNRPDLLDQWEQIRDWMSDHCLYDTNYFYNGNDWLFTFLCEEDRVKFILRWL